MNYTIITVAFNNLSGLKKTFKSLLPYSNNFDWLVIDGKSDDGSLDYLKKLSEQHSFLSFISENDRGIYDAMNKGALLSNSDYILFLNSGDEICFDCDFKSVKKLLQKNYDILFFSYYISTGYGRNIYKKAKEFSYIKHSLPTSHQSIFFKRNIFINHLHNLDYKICGDYEVCSNFYINNYTSYSSSIPFAIFELGGVSSQKPFQLAFDAFNVQKRILKLNRIHSSFSFLFRLLSLAKSRFLLQFM